MNTSYIRFCRSNLFLRNLQSRISIIYLLLCNRIMLNEKQHPEFYLSPAPKERMAEIATALFTHRHAGRATVVARPARFSPMCAVKTVSRP